MISLLKKLLLLLSFLHLTSYAIAEELVAPSALFDLSGQLPEIDPDVERRELGLPALESLDLEIGGFVGVMSIEDFGANYSYGVDATFHMTEDFFLSGYLGFSRISDQAYRQLNLPLFGKDRWRDVRTNGFLVGWNFLQGEMFWRDSAAFSASTYIVAGAGTINFDNEDYFQISTGVGLKLVPRDWMSIKVEAHFNEYESNLLGYKKYAHNTELLVGIAVNFW